MRSTGCRARGCASATRRREEKEGARTATSFVAVEVAPAGRSETGQGEAVQVEVGGVRVRVEEGASQALVERVLWVVKEVEGC